MTLYIGTAGWAIPAPCRPAFPAEGTTLQRYAARLPASEINSCFHRTHRPETYARWAASVGFGFRFSVKLPKSITHTQRLIRCAALLERFFAEIAGLGDGCGPVLVQLPPSLAFDAAIADAFFADLARHATTPLALEPRHATWFTPAVESFLADRTIARVAADPAKGATPGDTPPSPGGWPGLQYYRLHGSPRPYWSSYPDEWLHTLATKIRAPAAAENWIIFDNTASGAAMPNALRLIELLEPMVPLR